MTKPAEGFKVKLTGPGGRTKLHRCADCSSRKRGRTVAERDAFGHGITAQNQAARQATYRHNRNANSPEL